MGKRIKIFDTILVACTLIASLFLVSCSDDDAGQKAPPPGVSVSPVIRQDVATVFEYVGQTLADDDVDLRARVEGFLNKRDFKEGQFVKKDQLLFVIQKDQYIAEVNSAKANLAQKNAVLKRAQIDFNRQKGLFEKNAVAQKAFDDATCALASAQADVMAAQAQLETANLNLSYTDIKAPFEGKIGTYTYSIGNLVGPTSESLANIVKLNPMKVEFNISEADLVNALQQEGKTMKDEGPDRFVPQLVLPNGRLYKHKGTLSFWNNKVNSSTGTIMIRALFENPEQVLIPGLYVKVRLETRVKKSALLIPQAAVQQNQAGKFVLVVGPDNKVRQQSVTTGEQYGINIVVKEGLKEGERVITQGLQKVRPNMEVKPSLDKSTLTKTDGNEVKPISKTIPNPPDKPTKPTDSKTDKKAGRENAK